MSTPKNSRIFGLSIQLPFFFISPPRPFVMEILNIAILLPLYCYLYIHYINNARYCIYALYTCAIYQQYATLKTSH